MPEQLMKFILPVKEKWDALTVQQRIRLIATVLVLLVALIVTIYFMTRTKYMITWKNITSLEARDIQNVLNEANVKNKLVNNGTAIAVDEKKINEAKIEIETQNILTDAQFTYADALSNSGMSTTNDQRREMDRRSKQTDLSHALRKFNGVEYANVIITIPPQNSYFINDQYQATAGIALQTSRTLTRREGEQIARFVSRSIEGLSMENIHITDMEYNVLYSGSDLENDGFGSYLEQQEMEKREVANKIRTMHAPIYDDVQVAVNLIFNNDFVSEISKEYSPPVAGSDIGAPQIDSGMNSKATGANAGDEPGLGANDRIPMTYDTGNSAVVSSQQKEWETIYLYNEIIKTTETKPSSYLRDESSISVNLFHYKPYYQQTMMQSNRNFSQADWEQFKIDTKNRLITDNQEETDFLSMSITNATGISSVTVAVWELPVFVPYEKPPLDLNQIVMYSVLALLILMLAYGLIRRIKPEEEEELEPELSVEDLLVSTRIEEAREEAQKLDDIDYSKESEVKMHIDKFVNEKPEAVAQLLRNWLNSEEWA